MVYHLMLEARRPPSWFSGAHRDQHSARLRAALGALARDVALRWKDDATLAIVLRYEPDERRPEDLHQSALWALVRAADRAGLQPTGAVVTRVASHWTQGAIAGALTGLGLSQTQEERLGPAITLAAIALGAVAGAFLRREVPVYRALRLPYAGWRLVAVEPEVSGPRFRVGLA
ncbi:MAG TPA: hypothetical protein VLW53_01955 [Candidatus Eisenbacteria bacterium]|nr:hypothetical protein [Candidatus Eisenbacteria bacterium]